MIWIILVVTMNLALMACVYCAGREDGRKERHPDDWNE